jgi:hypothetical protein
VERLGDVVVGTEAEALDLILDAGEAGQNQDRCLDFCDAQGAQDLETRHVGQVEVEQDHIVGVTLGEVAALFSEVSRIDRESFALEHKLDGLRGRAIVLDEQ